MRSRQFILPIANELVVDLFAGGGGASTGIEQAIGRHVDIAINHDPEAVSLHAANHPQTRHFISDVFEVDPVAVCGRQPVGLLWASADCKHFSKVKGGKPVSKKIRSLAWVVVKWAKAVAPRVICLENVEEFQTWGPLTADGKPCVKRKGDTFRSWVAALQALGYAVEWRELRACDFGAPTIRKRLFLVARNDGAPIVRPEATHAGPATLPVRQKKLKPWRTAAECIDWSIPCPSIFDRARPLADATLHRIAKGVMRYVVESANPFIVPIAHYNGSPPAHDLDEPLRTITAHPKGGAFALVGPTLVQTGYGERAGQAPRALGLQAALGTIVSGQKHALVAAFLAKHYTGVFGNELQEPIGTVTCQDHHSLVAATLVHYHADKRSGDVRASYRRDPLKTQTTMNRHALATSHLVKLRGTSTAQSANEPLHTISAHGADGQPLTKTAQVRMCGNSVCPPLSRAIVAANYSAGEQLRKVA
jgi:DNA (cytosine-5)-methyltransferase 1